MPASKHDVPTTSPSDKLLRRGAEAELQILNRERKAEAKLRKAISEMKKVRAQLNKAQKRLDRSSDGVKAAEAALREAQAKRASGPDAPD
jgi:outer membrane protein TolC